MSADARAKPSGVACDRAPVRLAQRLDPRPDREHAGSLRPAGRGDRRSRRPARRDRPRPLRDGEPEPGGGPEAIESLAEVIATGRSDYPNQINNVLAFPGVFRGALDVRARTIDEEMELAAAHAVAD